MNPDLQVNQGKTFDLEARTLQFGRRVRSFVNQLPRTVCNIEDVKQLARSSGSVGANYIEANEAISKKDFAHRLRIARKEAKESRHWLRLLDTGGKVEPERERDALIQEATELVRIFSAILKPFEPDHR